MPYNNQSEKIESSPDVIQTSNDFTQLHLEDNRSNEFLNEIVKEMCDLYTEERLKSQTFSSTIAKLEEFLAKKNLNPAQIFNYCLENQFIHMNLLVLIANCYSYGIWVKKDEKKSFIYYKKSADMGNAYGMLGVGYCYQFGEVVEKDENKTFIYYKKSAEMGCHRGINNLGHCYENGIGVEKDESKAFICYQKAADMGCIGAMLNVADCYRNGIGTKRDLQKAKYWYQR